MSSHTHKCLIYRRQILCKPIVLHATIIVRSHELIFYAFNSQGPHVHEGSRRADVERAKQELELLCRLDPKQREDGRLRYTAMRSQDELHVHWKHHGHPRAVQAHIRTVLGHVQKKGILALVHRRRYGRDGIHRSRIEHERFDIRIPTVSGTVRLIIIFSTRRLIT